MVLWGVVKGHSAVQVWRGGALKPELETQTGLNVTSFHMSTFHLGSYSNPNCITVLWAGSGVTFRDIELMICTEVFQFMRQDDMSSDSMSRSPTATPSKVLQPFSSASIVQIRYWIRGKLLNEPLRKKESCLCVLDEDTEHHCIDEISTQSGTSCCIRTEVCGCTHSFYKHACKFALWLLPNQL